MGHGTFSGGPATRVPGVQRLLQPSAAGDEVVDQDDDRDDDEDVDEAAADVEGEAEQPQNHEDDKDSPKHGFSPFEERTPGG